MTEELIEEVDKYYHEIHSKWPIAQKKVGGMHKWKEWLKEKKLERGGFSWQTVSNLQTFLKKVYDQRKNPEILFIDRKGAERILTESVLEDKIEKAKEVLSILDRAISGDIVLDKTNDLGEFHRWFFYFLYVTPPDDVDHNPKIARTVLRIHKDRERKEKEARLENLTEPQSEDYIGVCEEVGTSGVWSFVLKNKRGNRKLYFNLDFPNTRYELTFGSYTTFDSNKIYSGQLVLERIAPDVDESDVSPLLICNIKSPENYEKVNENIREFLSQKSSNYLLVPRSKGNFDGLRDIIRKDSPFRYFDRRFFDYQRPRLFIASPQMTTDRNLNGKSITKRKSTLLKLRDELQTEFPYLQVDVDEKWDFKVDEEKIRQGTKSLINIANFKKLRRTKFFVIIIENTLRASFSLVELGYALAHCKYIYVLYKNNEVSKKIETIQSINTKNIETQKFEKSIDDEHEKIRNWIKSFVNKFSQR